MTYPPQSIFVPPRVATLLVAASNSLDRSKAQADYICDGVADQVQINDALNALPAGGGRVMLSEGTFTIDDPIAFPASNITLEGQGRGTFIDGDGLATGEHGIVISGRTDCAVKNLAIQTEDGGGKTCHCIFVENGSHYVSIENVMVVASDSDGIHIEGTATNNARIHRCTIEGVDDNGICNNTSAVINRLHISECTIISPGNHGIAVGLTDRGATNFEITGNIIYSPGADGIHTRISDSGTISDNAIFEPSNYAIYLWAVWTAVTGNSIYCPGNYGIYVYNCENTISGNTIYRPTSGGGIHLTSDADKTVVAGNTITYGVGDNIIFIDGAENVDIVGNVLEGNDVAKGIHVAGPYANVCGNFIYGRAAGITEDAIHVASGGDYANIAGNLIYAAWNCCILIGDGATHINITGNHCYKAHTDGIKLEANNTECSIVGNLCYDNSGYGINIAAATCTGNLVKENKLTGNTSGCILNSGVNTGLATYVVPFSGGTDPQDSGYLIDADTEYARAWLRLPAEVQQVVRMKIYARAVVLSAAAMRLEINANGGADNEPYNTHATAAPNTPSTSTNFAANDVIFWALTVAGIVALLGGDSVEVKVLHEAAGDGDVATNAYIRTVEIEYV